MTVPANAILRLVATLAMPDSTIAQNIFYLKFLADGTSTDEQDVLDDCEAYIDAIYTELEGAMSTAVSGVEMHVYIRDVVGGDWDEIGKNAWTFVGTNATDMAPHGVAALVHARTTDPDVNAAKYFPGFVEANFTGSTVIASALTVLVAASVDWVTVFAGPNTLSAFDPGVWSTKNLAFFDFNLTTIIPTIVAYQRRRKPGVGI